MPKKRDTHLYELYDGREKVYIGTSDDPESRADQHKAARKKFTRVVIKTPKLTKESAEEREDKALQSYMRSHKRLPKYNKTESG